MAFTTADVPDWVAARRNRPLFSESQAEFQEYGDLHFVNVARSELADTARLEKDFYYFFEAVWSRPEIVYNQEAGREIRRRGETRKMKPVSS